MLPNTPEKPLHISVELYQKIKFKGLAAQMDLPKCFHDSKAFFKKHFFRRTFFLNINYLCNISINSAFTLNILTMELHTHHGRDSGSEVSSKGLAVSQ